jgi:hypothetical protein
MDKTFLAIYTKKGYFQLATTKVKQKAKAEL